MKYLITLCLVIFHFAITPADAYATAYYVSPNGNDSAAGTSHATAWRTVAKANSGPSGGYQVGDDLYFECGGVWVGTYLSIRYSGATANFNGSAANSAVIGAYYWNGSTEVVGVSGAKPILEGVLKTNDMCTSYPLIYNGMITITGDRIYGRKNYITVQDIHIKNSGADGIRLFMCDKCNVTRCTVEGAGQGGIITSYTNENETDTTIGGLKLSEISYNTVSLDNVFAGCRCVDGIHVWSGGDRVAGIAVYNGQHAYIHHNTMHSSRMGEAYGLYRVSKTARGTYSTVEDNWAWDRGYGLYYAANAEGNIVRRNVILHSGNSTYCTSTTSPRSWCSSAYVVGNEEDAGQLLDGRQQPGQSNNNYFYDNIAVGTGSCFTMWSQWPSGYDWYENVYFFNNVCIGNKKEVDLYNAKSAIESPASGHTSSVYIYNNIFDDISSFTTEEANVSGTKPSANLYMDYNYWNETPATGWLGPHDTVGTSVISAGIDALVSDGPPQILNVQNFVPSLAKPPAGSAYLIDKGTTVSSTYRYDWDGVDRSANTPWDIGMYEYVSSTPELYCGDGTCNGSETCGSDDVAPHCNTDCGACPSSTTLLLRWPMEDASSPIVDPVGGYNLTLSGTTRTGGVVDTYSRSFNGTSDYGYRDGINGLKEAFSLCGWFYPNEVGRNQHLFGTIENHYRVRLSTANNVVFTTYDTTARSLIGPTVTIGAWHHVCAAFDGSYKYLYVDGSLYGSPVAASSIDADTTINVGRCGSWGEYFNGMIDDVRFYTGAISGSDVSTLYSGGSPASPPVLAEYHYVQIPTTGTPRWSFTSTKAGTLTMSGPCKTDTSTVIAGVNDIEFARLGKGYYSDCSIAVNDGSDTTTLNVSPFSIDYWALHGGDDYELKFNPSGDVSITTKSD